MTQAVNGVATTYARGSAARRKRLFLGIVALLGCAGAEAANTFTVTSCTDTGPADTGNLRNSISMAADGDTVDAGGLINCPNSKITLALGQIPIAVNNLMIAGSFNFLTGQTLIVDGQGNGQNGMFRHAGTGTLTVSSLILDHGYVTNNTQAAKGGAIYSAGAVSLRSVSIYRSFANTVTGKAYGGAVYDKAGFNATYGVFAQNKAVAQNAAGTSLGGAIFSNGVMTLTYATVSGNGAYSPSDNGGSFGGIDSNGSTFIQNSTISGNTAHAHVGGLGVFGKPLGNLTLIDSTISGNTATKGPIGGVWAYTGNVSMTNPTIVHNTAGMGSFNGGPLYAPGLAVSYAYLSMTNALIANNGYGATLMQNDLTLGRNGMLKTIQNNLVRTTAVALPPDTKKGVCPLLGPLRNNGGVTKTHALLSHSPAIDAGVATARNEDQRGKQFDVMPPFPFPRQSGAATDIGAYEVEQNDIVFNTSFEGCP